MAICRNKKCSLGECDQAETCSAYIPIMTNADLIRTMSDEQLAVWLYCFADLECKIPFCKNLAECDKLLDTEDGIPEEKCNGCLLEWLKQPVEKEERWRSLEK